VKRLLYIACILVGNVAFSQQFGTLLVSDYDDPLVPVEGAEVVFEGRLLGTTNHVGSFHFPEKIRGTITLSHPDYTTRELKVKTKEGLVTETDMTAKQEIYNLRKEADSKIIYATCIAEQEVAIPVSGANTQKAFEDYVASVIRYPKRARDHGEEGTVQLRFRVEADGLISCVEIVKGVSYELDKEAYRILSGMPNWEPAKRDGIPVSSTYSTEIRFTLKR
jgi:TonB family protein